MAVIASLVILPVLAVNQLKMLPLSVMRCDIKTKRAKCTLTYQLEALLYLNHKAFD